MSNKNYGYGRALAALGLLASLASGCGDGPICPSEIVVVIQTPTGGSLSSVNDNDATAAGIQSDVTVRSNLAKGDELVLTIVDGSGAVAQSQPVTADGDGNATFANVTFPAGDLSLSVQGISGNGCGTGSDELELTVVTQALCELSIDEGPIANDFFAPIPVLNSTNDSDSELPNFQANFTVQSTPGFDVEIFVLDVGAGSEASIGTAVADSNGVATFQATLAQGRQAMRATCRKDGINEASATSTVQVDTVVPTCNLTDPVAGVTVTPDRDSDDLISNGIQMTWRGSVDDGSENDTEGESAAFYRNSAEFAGQAISADGLSFTDLGEFTAPGTFAMSFETQDHAGNPCVGGFDVPVIMDGCSISIDEPSTIVTSDSDGINANGLQANFTVTVGTACVGQNVFVNCGQGERSGVAPAGGITTITNVTLDPDPTSEGSASCVARVVNPELFQTTDSRNVTWDTQAPGVTLNLLSPAPLACGDQIARTAANDVNGDLSDGFQISVSVSAPLAATRDVTVTNSAGTSTTPAPALGAAVNVTLLAGNNDVRGLVSDANGNTATTGGCVLRLEDILVNIQDPAGSGLLGIADGALNGDGDLELVVCATSSEPDVTMTFSLDSGADLSTSFNGTAFCTDAVVAFSEGAHTLSATAQANVGTREGSASIDLNVDLTAPAAPGNLTAIASDHQTIDVAWSPVAGAAYEVRFGFAPFSADPSVFVTEGEIWPGSIVNETTQIAPVDAGTEYHIGVMAVDAAGNRSNASSVGPVIPAYDGTGAFVEAGVSANARFGQNIVRGDFNDDSFGDIAIAAPLEGNGVVYIYYGSSEGIATPGTTDIEADVTITGADPFFGYSMARLDWSGLGDGLAIGNPIADGGNGNVLIYHHGKLSSPGNLTTTIGATGPDLQIVAAGTVGDWFTGGFMGWSMTSGQLNSANSLEDLIIGVFSGGAGGGKSGTAGDGGVVMLHGGTIPAGQTTITLSRNASSAAMQGLAGLIFQNPQATVNSSGFGERMAYLGDTRIGNGVGDVAIAYLSDVIADTGAGADLATTPSDNVIYVLRGRTTAAPGMAFTFLNAASDLTIVNPSTDATMNFGISMGSISDQNGSGFRDIVIGANEEGATRGRVWIVDGSRSGTVVLNGTTDYLTRITASTLTQRAFGTGIANNALTTQSDINGDLLEDLVISGGTGANTSLFVWYGGNIPPGDSTTATANYLVEGTAEFTNPPFTNSPAVMPVQWAGDVNDDGLADLCWADYRATQAGVRSGVAEVLFDE